MASVAEERTRAATPEVDPALLKSLEWRLIGPFRGGRVVAVAGDPAHDPRPARLPPPRASAILPAGAARRLPAPPLHISFLPLAATPARNGGRGPGANPEEGGYTPCAATR